MDGLEDNIGVMLRDKELRTMLQYEILKSRIFEPCTLCFISSTEESSDPSYSHIPDTINGFYEEVKKMGQSTLTIPKVGDPFVASPFSLKLRPVVDMSTLANYPEVFLTKIRYRIVDPTINSTEGTDAGQNATMLSILNESILNTTADAYAQSRFRFGEIGGYLLSAFRPFLQTNGGSGKKFFGSSGRTAIPNPVNGDQQHLGDLTVGQILPYEFEPPFMLSLGKLDNSLSCIEIYAFAGQLYNDSGTIKVLRYPVIAEVELLLLKERI